VSDYVSCPSCRGRGLIPLEKAQQIGAHAQAEADDRQRAAWEHRAGMVRQDNELRQRTVEQRKKDAEDRLRKLEELVSGKPAGPQTSHDPRDQRARRAACAAGKPGKRAVSRCPQRAAAEVGNGR